MRYISLKSTLFGVDPIFYLFPKAGVSENAVNLKILSNGDVMPIKISDLFYPEKDWQTNLLLIKGGRVVKKAKIYYLG